MYTSYLNLFQTHTDYEMYLLGNNTIPNVIYCTEENHMHYLRNDNNPNKPSVLTKNYFTTVARENGTISFNIWESMGTEYITSISYSTDNGETWITINNTNDKEHNLVIDVNVNKGDKVLWKGNATQLGAFVVNPSDDTGSFFSSTCEFDVTGNIMSLLYSDNFNDKTAFENTHAFCRLFSDYNEDKICKIVNAKNLLLPAISLTDNCYYGMFWGCTSLINAPKLPATQLAEYCYSMMFYGCTSLITAPELPAIQLIYCCYDNMFSNCTSLINAPELPATTLAQSCYYKMFDGCTSLTKAPSTLPATTLQINCYNSMFKGCTSLITAPVLSATNLTQGCYGYMFYGCTNLNSITCLATDISGTNCTNNWVNNVSVTGTFIKHPSMENWDIGNNGIPEGWTITNAVSENYLTFNILSDGIINWKANNSSTTVKTISYSINDGEWTDITSSVSGTSFNVNTGDKIRFKGNNNAYATSTSNHNTFNGSTASFNLEGNIMSLIDEVLFDYITTLNTDYTFAYLFSNTNVIRANLILPAIKLSLGCYYGMFKNCKNLITAPELPATTLADYCYPGMFWHCTSLTIAPELPATILADSCYSSMFSGCTNLTIAPELTATTLAEYCYYSMFYGCTGLTTAPELLTTTLADDCYYQMFRGCTSLTKAPELPATILADSCYKYMFTSCTSLTTAPELPATTLAESCYDDMFRGCTSLTKAPELPATQLADSCYKYMFNGCINLTKAPELPAATLVYYCYNCMFRECTSLNSITCLATDISATNCIDNWVSNVASIGTFIKANNMNDWTKGINGIPSNWSVENYYTNKYFTTEARENGTISFNIWESMGTEYITSISYSTNNGETWVTTNNTNNKTENLVIDVNVDEGDKVLWKGNATQLGAFIEHSPGDDVSSFFSSTCEFDATGNIMSLLYSDNFNDKTTFENTHAFCRLFSDYNEDKTCKIVNANNLILPVTTLDNLCYYCMFYGCTRLTTAPELPATTLANYCYRDMFRGCTSLTKAPELPATQLTRYCYANMFEGCINLTKAPELPATILVYGCYQSMFWGCTSLIKAPLLPANKLEHACYLEMFRECTSLNSITCLATDISANLCTTNWVDNVATTGTFTKHPSMNNWPTGDRGIPENWNIQNYKNRSLIIYVDDFPQEKLNDNGETVEEVMNRELNNFYGVNRYDYTGETIEYNGNTYYLWKIPDEYYQSDSNLSSILYLLTTTIDSNTLYSQSLEDDLTNHFTSFAGRLDEDKEEIYSGDTAIGTEQELYLVKVVHNILRIWIDDFPRDDHDELDGEPVQDVMQRAVEDPESQGNNPYDYTGETIEYNGNTYYLWKAVSGYDVDNSSSMYFATTTIDFQTLYSQSLEDDLSNHFTAAIGQFYEDKHIYFEQGINTDDNTDRHYLVKVEML